MSAGLMNSPQTIDHAQALRGGVTPLDAPGYPVTISRPGHYRLSGDLVVPAHADGILITAPDVTLDLNGHTVRGPVRCAHSPQGRTVECNWLIEPSLRSGISTVAAPRSVVRNGAVSGFAGFGIHHGESVLIENVEVSSNAGAGIAGSGSAQGGVVRHVLVRHNGAAGIVCDGMTVERSSFIDNGGHGVECRRAVVSDSVSRGNGGFGSADGHIAGLRTINNRQGAVAPHRDAPVAGTTQRR